MLMPRPGGTVDPAGRAGGGPSGTSVRLRPLSWKYWFTFRTRVSRWYVGSGEVSATATRTRLGSSRPSMTLARTSRNRSARASTVLGKSELPSSVTRAPLERGWTAAVPPAISGAMVTFRRSFSSAAERRRPWSELQAARRSSGASNMARRFMAWSVSCDGGMFGRRIGFGKRGVLHDTYRTGLTARNLAPRAGWHAAPCPAEACDIRRPWWWWQSPAGRRDSGSDALTERGRWPVVLIVSNNVT